MCLFALHTVIRGSIEVQSVTLIFKRLQVGLGTLQVHQAELLHRPEPQGPRALVLFCTELITLVSALFLVNPTTAHQGACKSALCCSVWNCHQAGRTCCTHPALCAVEIFEVAEVQRQ